MHRRTGPEVVPTRAWPISQTILTRERAFPSETWGQLAFLPLLAHPTTVTASNSTVLHQGWTKTACSTVWLCDLGSRTFPLWASISHGHSEKVDERISKDLCPFKTRCCLFLRTSLQSPVPSAGLSTEPCPKIRGINLMPCRETEGQGRGSDRPTLEHSREGLRADWASCLVCGLFPSLWSAVRGQISWPDSELPEPELPAERGQQRPAAAGDGVAGG